MPVIAAPTLAVAAKPVSLRRARPLLGTLVEIQVEADDRTRAQQALAAAFAEVADVQHLMSFHEHGSDLARLNRAPAGALVEVDTRTAEVLRWAAEFRVESDGAFDVSVAGLMLRIGLLPGPPMESIAPIRATDGDRYEIRRGAHRVDLGGIAKGYAVDRAIDALVRCGVTSALINAGGDLRHHGTVPTDIHLRDPSDPSRIASRMKIANIALASSATSGLAGSKAEGPSMLIDTRKRAPLLPGGGVTIAAPRCLLADALTKVVLVSGDTRHPMLRRHGAHVVAYRAARAEPA